MRKYYGITQSKNGNIYRVEIWDAPSGSSTGGSELRMASPGFSLTYDKQGGKLYENQIQTSKIQAQFVVTETADHNFFQNLAVEYEGDFALVVYKNNNIFYIGRIIADQMQYQRRPELNTIYTITAIDSLSLFDSIKVKKSWFNSTTKRMTILELIRRSLSETFVVAYQNHLGFGNDFIMDIGADLPTGSPGYFSRLEFNISSTIENLNNFIEIYNDEDIYIDCQKAIERLLKISSCKLIYSNGIFTIYDPILSASTATIYAFIYSTTGTYTSRPTVNTQYAISDGVRPCFTAFPIYTHQPPLKYIKQSFLRQGFNYNIRTYNNQSASQLSTNLVVSDSTSTSILVNAVLNWITQSFTGTTPPNQFFINLNFRIYVNGGGSGYKHYDYQNKTWTVFQPNKPFYESIRSNITNYQIINTQFSKSTIDFNRSFVKPSQDDNVEVEFLIGNISWNWLSGSIQNNIQFWGVTSIFEQDLAPRVAYTENTKNLKATEIIEDDVIYGYNLSPTSPNGVGTIWRSDINFTSNLTADFWANRAMSIYANAPKTIQATLIDDGDYKAILCPSFDSESYAFNGGQFSALEEIWDFELIKIAQDVDAYDYNELDFQDEMDINKQQNNAVFRIVQQGQQFRDSISNITTDLGLDLLRLSPNTPTVAPTVVTRFTPFVTVNSYEETTWSIKENGKSITYNAGEYTLNPNNEILICDTSIGNVVINLPNANEVKGLKYQFKKPETANIVQINGVIDGVSVYVLQSKNESVIIESDGSTYWAVSDNKQKLSTSSNVLIDGGTFEDKNSFIDAGSFVTE